MIGRATAAVAAATALAAAARWKAALRNRPRPASKLVMLLNLSWCGGARRHQPIAHAAHGLHDQRVARIAFDLAAQPIDLHIHRALADRLTVAGERLARHGLAGAGREHAQHFALAVGQPDHLFAAAQFAAREVKHELAEPYRLHR